MAETSGPTSRPTPRSSLRLGCGLFLVIAVLVLAVPIVYLAQHLVLRQLPAVFARPLAAETVQETCSLLGLAGDSRCDGRRVYGFEFLSELAARYAPGTPWDQVADELGPYQVRCTEWINRGESGDFMDCFYAVDGNHWQNLYLTVRKDAEAPERTASVARSCSPNIRRGSLWDIYACRPALNSGLLLVLSDNTFLVGPGFGVAFVAVDVALLALLIWLARRANVGQR